MTDVNDIQGDDTMIPGQIGLFELMDEQDRVQGPLVAVSKVFAAAIKQMSLKEWKTLIFALMHIKWTENQSEVVHLDKWELVKLLGIQSDASDVSAHLRRDIGDMYKHSGVEFADKDRDLWENGNFIERIACYKNTVRIVFAKYYMPLFCDLKAKGYITMWADDLFQMSSERSVLFYESLRLHSDTTRQNTRIYGTKDLKIMFGIPKDGKGSYMRKDGHLDRPAFEKRVIGPLCDDLSKCKMLSLVYGEDGKPWRKVHYHGRVIGYEFSWTVSTHPAVASAEEVAEIQERVDKNPQILKVAKDLVEGEKKKRKKKTQLTERDYDFKKLEEELIKNK